MHPEEFSTSNSQHIMSQAVPHFSVVDVKNHQISAPADCRAHIEEIVCLVENDDPTSIPDEERPCLEGGQAYTEPFQALYDHYPPALQRMFCSLSKIYVEKEFFGTAYAGLLRDEAGSIVGARMGIRQSVIDERLDLTTWASWKEQLNFGGVKDSYTITDDLPEHRSTSKSEVNDFLYFVTAHEFGHIFDFVNEVNKIDPACQGDECGFAEGSWGDMSWESFGLAKGLDEFPGRKDLCFYWCEMDSVALDRVPQIYRDLHRSHFISTYATTQAWDDFADSMAYVVMDYYLATDYTIDTKQSAVYDVMAKLRSERFREKREYISRFLSGALAYP